MPSSPDSISMALFCDFENVALGVRDAKYEKFDIKLVLERLLLKGSIVVKKAYCDWDRYKGFKAAMHEANFELIEIPHVRQSGKNSADIRLVVDALDLCYTKSHVDTFVIISGDSDFSPLVSKLRENAKQVIGVGVKQSTSDLLIANCDEFIFYDDLVREQIRIADGKPLSVAQEDIEFHGHAIECRINAEDPWTFAPSPGLVNNYHAAGGMHVRVDSGLYAGYKIPPYYDSMIAKLIVSGRSREGCIMRLKRALEEMVIGGVKTSIPLHQALMNEPDFIHGDYTIKWLEEWLAKRQA